MQNTVEQLDQAERLLEQLEQVSGQLEGLQRGLTQSHRLASLGTMSSILAHEFNNILTPVISYCQMALQSPDDQAFVRKALTKALQGAERAARISRSLLGFAGDDDADKEPALVGEVVDEVFICMARSPQRDGIDLDVCIPAGMRVQMTAVALQQVLLNLVLNACQAMEGQGSGRLRIVAAAVTDGVEVEVTDSGPGIPPALRSRIFEPFVTQAPAPGPGKRKGTGLGLSICRDLVQDAGGRIEVSRSDATGTSFRMILPAASG
ncbi:MAG: ATP-binding protein [Phycisphaerae bacterium]|nr:ATP-binding protein [Phycisphaerae bacterium]